MVVSPAPLIPFVDAAYAPSPAEAAAAYAAGYRGCGFYLPGIPNSDPLNVWTPAQVNILRAAGLEPFPIVVPDPNLAGAPMAAASAARSACLAFGLAPTVSILYTGNHLEQSGTITGPIWIPAPGPAPATIGAGSAVQWGSTSIAGWAVDLDTGAPTFPFSQGIVVDFEYNTTGGPAGAAWYSAFQAVIGLNHQTLDPALPSALKGDDVLIIACEGQPTYAVGGGVVVKIPDMTDVSALAAQGATVFRVDAAMSAEYGKKAGA